MPRRAAPRRPARRRRLSSWRAGRARAPPRAGCCWTRGSLRDHLFLYGQHLVAFEDLAHRFDAVRVGLDHHADLVLGHGRAVQLAFHARGQAGGDEKTQHGDVHAAQDQHFIGEHEVRRQRDDGLAALELGKEVALRGSDPQETQAGAHQRAHEGVLAYRDGAHAQDAFDIGVLDRRLDRDIVPVQVRKVGAAQLLQRRRSLVEIVEQAQYAFDRHASLTSSLASLRWKTISLTSYMETLGTSLQNSMKSMPNQPKLPKTMPHCTQDGKNVWFQVQGSYPCENVGVTIIQRSSHMPRLSSSDRIIIIERLARTRLKIRPKGTTEPRKFIAHQ